MLPMFSMFAGLFGFVPAIAILSILVSIYLYFYIERKPSGTKRMKEIAAAIKEGSDAYLKREYMALALFVAIMAIGLFLPVS